MLIELIRHGRTAGNLEHRYVGSTDESLLEETIQELEKRRGSFPVPDALIVSPMKRCMQTAEGLFPGIAKKVVPELKECEFGAFEYKNYKELQDDEQYQAWIDSNGTIAFPGGESREQFISRCSSAFVAVCKQALMEGYERIAFVVHGGTIMAILDQFAEPHKDYFEWQVKNLEGFEGILLEENGSIKIREIRVRKS